ncbi:uncharacterized protein LOC111787126 [Cucurbita pepo subsp. pepo]|uniref:uncharacterized protein LOC111787126 n=1 Tax=Cucurbita pepo subsp. pepo TaxID=3664 RepID=UPI000C9D529E|nr:uncharacterized protein LOC111787126 [Cucurbita pepo subsp. pepo]
MEALYLSTSAPTVLPFRKTVGSRTISKSSILFPSSSKSRFATICRQRIDGEDTPLSNAMDAYRLFGVDPTCSESELKAAFRAKVKQFHPDVNRDGNYSDSMIRRVIQAYEVAIHL